MLEAGRHQCLFWTAARYRQSSTWDTCTGSPPFPGVPVSWDGKSPAKVSPSSFPCHAFLQGMVPKHMKQSHLHGRPLPLTACCGSLAKALVNTNHIVGKAERDNSGIIWSHLPPQERSSRAHCTDLWSDSPGISQVGDTPQPGQSVPVHGHLHRVLPHIQVELI